MSRMTRVCLIALLLFSGESSLVAQDLSAEEALANYNALTKVEDKPRCQRAADPDEIVVCARDTGPNPRLPLPNERGPREGARTATGDVAAASAAPMRTGSCGVQATDTGCTGGLPILGAATLVAKAIGKLVEGED